MLVAALVWRSNILPLKELSHPFKPFHFPLRGVSSFKLRLVISDPHCGVRVAGFSPQEIKEVADMRAALESLLCGTLHRI